MQIQIQGVVELAAFRIQIEKLELLIAYSDCGCRRACHHLEYRLKNESFLRVVGRHRERKAAVRGGTCAVIAQQWGPDQSLRLEASSVSNGLSARANSTR